MQIFCAASDQQTFKLQLIAQSKSENVDWSCAAIAGVSHFKYYAAASSRGAGQDPAGAT
jgi:hypothetical protein